MTDIYVHLLTEENSSALAKMPKCVCQRMWILCESNDEFLLLFIEVLKWFCYSDRKHGCRFPHPLADNIMRMLTNSKQIHPACQILACEEEIRITSK